MKLAFVHLAWTTSLAAFATMAPAQYATSPTMPGSDGDATAESTVAGTSPFGTASSDATYHDRAEADSHYRTARQKCMEQTGEERDVCLYDGDESHSRALSDQRSANTQDRAEAGALGSSNVPSVSPEIPRPGRAAID